MYRTKSKPKVKLEVKARVNEKTSRIEGMKECYSVGEDQQTKREEDERGQARIQRLLLTIGMFQPKRGQVDGSNFLVDLRSGVCARTCGARSWYGS